MSDTDLDVDSRRTFTLTKRKFAVAESDPKLCRGEAALDLLMKK